MENIKTRFNNLKYEHFKIDFKGLTFEVKLLDDSSNFPNSDNKDLVEEFKVIVTNKDKSINYKFYNSIMERNLSKELEDYKNTPYTFSQIKKCLRSIKGWGGYDDTKNLREFENKRIYHLIYSILNCFALDKETETESFKDFCDSFGYDEDSIKAEKIFKAVEELKQKINSLNLSKEQEDYFINEVDQETDKFQEDLKEVLK